MKITPLLFALFLVSLTACSTDQHRPQPAPPAQADAPETVIVYYYVKAGQEAALQDTLGRAWAVYQQERMVLPQPHVIVREEEKKETGSPARFIEIFTWVSHAAPQHAPDSVQAIWSQMKALCDPRGFGGGEVELLTPSSRASQP